MRNSYRHALLVTTALNMSVAIPAVAKAADDTPQTSGVQQIEQIVVTATRREEKLQNVPISIKVFNQQQLSNQNVINATDLAKITPSLSTNTNYGSENSSFAIRGFVQDLGTAPSVGVFFADVVAPRGASNGVTTGDGAGPGDFFDLQNVQVLKGPQGTLFGRNTTGGSVLLVPQMPTSDFGGYVEGSIGNYNLRGIQGVINLPINDHIRLRVGVDHESRDGYLHNTSGIGPKDFDDVNYTTVRATLDVDVTSNIEDTLIASYTNSDTHGSVQKLTTCDPASGLSQLVGGFGGVYACQQLAVQGKNFYDVQQSMQNPSSKLQTWRAIDTATWTVNDDLTVKNIASYAQLKDDLTNPLFGTNFSTGTAFGFLPQSYNFDFSVVDPVVGGHSANENTYTEELQLQGHSLGDRFIWQGGFYMEGSGPIGIAGSQSPVLASCTNSATYQCLDPVGFLSYLGQEFAGLHPSQTPLGSLNYTAGTTTYQDYAAYAQGTYKLTDEFKVTGGIRFTKDREANDSTRITNYFNYPVNPTTFAPNPVADFPTCTDFVSAPSCVIKQVEKSKAPTWLIDFDYTPDDSTLAYAKYSRGYRAGVISPNIFPPQSLVGPEKVDAYEVGLKKSFDGWLPATLDMAGFYNNFSNQQIQIGFDANPTYLCADATNPGCAAPVAPTASPVNVGQSRIWGFELDSSVSPFQGLTLTLGYTYLNTRIEKVTPLVLPPGSLFTPAGEPVVGDTLALSPKNKASLNASYVLPLDPSLGNITIGATFTHTDKQLTNYNDRTTLAGAPAPQFAYLDYIKQTNLLDLSLNWQHVLNHPFDVSVFATNVTGVQYYTFVPGLISGTGFETAAVGQPAMYGIRLRYDFGDN